MSPYKSIAAVCGQPNPPLTVTYHRQNRDPVNPFLGKLYCGAASAQMVLDSIGVGLLDQDHLYDSNYDNSLIEKWHAAPDGLEYTMRKNTPTGFVSSFKRFEHPSDDAISRKICWSISNYGIAPIVLVYRNQHWVVVTGFRASAWPASSDDTTYTIESFEIYDPWPQRTTDASHANCNDDCAPSQVPISYQEWLNNYLAPVLGGHWHGQHVVICASDPPAQTERTTPPMQTERTAPAVEGGFVDDTEEIINRASRGLAAFELDTRDPWSRVLPQQQAHPGQPRSRVLPQQHAHPGQPLLVERVDVDPTRFYYIVPFILDERVPFLVKVGASQNGSFDSSIAAPAGATTHFSQALDRDTVAEAFDGRKVDVGDQTVTLQATDLYPHLVWQPCAESLSPYWPFYRFDVGGPNSDTKVYVRIDGELFPELHSASGM